MGQATKKIDKLRMRCDEELLGKLVDTKISENMTDLQEKLQNAYENFKRDVDALSKKYKWIEISNKHVLAVEYKDDYVLFMPKMENSSCLWIVMKSRQGHGTNGIAQIRINMNCYIPLYRRQRPIRCQRKKQSERY